MSEVTGASKSLRDSTGDRGKRGRHAPTGVDFDEEENDAWCKLQVMSKSSQFVIRDS